jgi:hypothetical protein
VDSEQGTVFVWHGCKTNEYHRASAEKAANFIQERWVKMLYCRLLKLLFDTAKLKIYFSCVAKKIDKKIFFLHSFAAEKNCSTSLVVENFKLLSDLSKIA